MMEISIVTGFFDIGRGEWLEGSEDNKSPNRFARSNETYLSWFKNLAKLPNHMVIVTEQKFSDMIYDIRKSFGLERLTEIFVMDDLFGPEGRMGKIISNFDANMIHLHKFVRNPNSPEYWNPNYVLVNALKSTFVCTAIKLAKFIHQQVAWIDFGYCRDSQRFDPSTSWRFDCKKKMNMFYIREPDNRPIFDVVQTGDVYFQGSPIVGPADGWFHFGKLIDDAYTSLLACGLVDDDQTAMLMAYRREPHFFRIHAVDPSDWFVVLRTFRER